MKKFPAILLYSIIGLSLLVYSGCDDNPLKPTTTQTTQLLPSAVGMLWTYAIRDNLTGHVDTVRVSVIDPDTLEGVPVTAWREEDIMFHPAWTWYIGTHGDTTEFYIETDSLYVAERFVAPLNQGAAWAGPEFGDTSRVVDSGLIIVAAGSYSDGVRVDRVWNRDFEGGGNSSTTWIVPEVGFVSRHFHHVYSDGATIDTSLDETWELLDFDPCTFPLSDFPNEVGSWWRYELYDSQQAVFDTMLVTITGTIAFDNIREATVWEYSNGETTYERYVVVDGNRVTFYNQPMAMFPSMEYTFPLTLGRFWGIETFAPVPDDIDKGPVTTAAGEFSCAFKHVYFTQGFNFWSSSQSWVSPGVGMVFSINYEIDLGPQVTTTWELLEYHQATP